MTSWWNKNVQNRLDDFKGWIGDLTHPTKLYCRQYVASKGYKTIIDCGCGIATEYYGYKQDGTQIEYTGLDSCSFLVKMNQNQGIPMIEAELEGELPVPDNSYECVYCREVIEHLSYYEKTINEFIRIAAKEVLISWFIKPENEEEEINYWTEEDLYHNKYNKEKLEKFILSNPKVDRIEWVEVTEKENILHIRLK